MTSRYTQKDLASYVIYDTRSPCVLVPYAPINSRDKGVLAELEKFFDEGITLASKFDTSGGFHGSLFSIDTLPKNMIMSEFPDYSGDSSTNIYFRNSLGQGSTASVARKEFDRLKDLFSTLFPDDTQREKATSLSEISSFYQRALSDGEFMLSGSTASGDPYYLSYIQSKSPEKGKVYSAV